MVKVRVIEFKGLKIIIDLIDGYVGLKTSNGKSIGRSSIAVNKKTKDLYISDFDISDEHRSKGYGNFLARVIIDLAKLQKLRTVSLIDGSTLEGFWQRLGFVFDSKKELMVLKV